MSILQRTRHYERGRRFWRKVDVGGPDDCWPWLGRSDRDGHGVHAGKPAHETSYALANGPLPPGASLRQRCGNPRCVNPRHLEARPPES